MVWNPNGSQVDVPEDKGVELKLKLALRATAGVLALGVALTGCSGNTGNSSNEAAGSPAPTTLNLSLQAPPSDFSVGNWGGGDATAYTAVYDGLLSQDLEGKLSPGVAESWEVSEDGRTLTFKIRSGQKFSNGEALDAKAVAASLEHSRKSPGSSAQLQSISSVEAPDDSTVVITLVKPDASIVYQLAGTPGVIGAPSSLESPDSKLTPVGSGPYTLDTTVSNTGSVYVLKKNPDNWNAESYPFETVKFQVIADPTAVQNAMKTGQLDFATLNSPELAKQFPADKFVTGAALPQAVGGLMIVDREGKVVPALGDVRVRQAINYAIDRKLIAEKLTPGSASPTNQMVSPSGEAYSKELEAEYAHNLDKAKALMKEAGYESGFSVTMPSTVLSTTYDAILSQQLGEIGITVNYETVPFQDLYSKLYAGSYGMFFFYLGFSGADAKDVGQALAGSFNPFNSTTPELQKLLETANTAPADEQGTAFAAVNKYLVDQAWFAPVSYATGTWVSSKAINYTPSVVSAVTLLPWTPAK